MARSDHFLDADQRIARGNPAEARRAIKVDRDPRSGLAVVGDIAPGAAIDYVATFAAIDAVVAATAAQGVGTGVAMDQIIPGIAVDRVRRRAAVQVIAKG